MTPDAHARMRSRLRMATTGITAAVILLCCGCAATSRPPRAPRLAPGYEQRCDALSAVDMTFLAGKRVALDPGHGGFFRGSMGVNGLSEADANLGVALHLRGLLEARGATVFMTRTDDRDFLAPADSSLRADLAERMRRANAFDADLFVSIHHNADPGGAHDRNETQTYYKLNDEGPSLDAAESVHRYLVRNLGIAQHRILPGNYFVLRNSIAPALLTESSYITNPDVEAKLVLGQKQRLEAEALLLGIAGYFARGAPRIASLVAREAGEPDAAPDSLFTQVASPRIEARIDGPFDDVELTLDGKPLSGTRDGDRLAWDPPPLATGLHAAVLDVRTAGRGAARPRMLHFQVLRTPSTVVMRTLTPAPSPGVASLAAVRIAIVDHAGFVVRDTLSLALHMGPDVVPADTVVVARDGVAYVYPRLRPRSALEKPRTLEVRLRGAAPGEGGAARWPLDSGAPTGGAPMWSGLILDAAGAPLSGALGTAEPERSVDWLTRDGFAVVPVDSTGAPRVPWLPGYRRLADTTAPTPRLVPVAGGALHGRRIVIDPDGGGDVAAGVGPSGTRAAHVNLRVARILAGFLAAAGAEVRLTRAGDFALSDVERVQISEAFGAERYLRIGHRPEPPRLGHYFASAAGRAWAGRTARRLAGFGFERPAIGDDAQYAIQQTSCPAIYVSPARIDRAASEEALLAPGALRREAYALYLALAGEWAADSAWTLDSLEVRDTAGRAVAGAMIRIGGSLLLETGGDGRVRFARTEPGPVEAAVEDPRVMARAILLDSSSGATLTGPRGD